LIDITFIKVFQITKGPSEVDNLSTSKLDRYKVWAIHFCKINIGVENKDPRIYV
jgi:hypothetical protein